MKRATSRSHFLAADILLDRTSGEPLSTQIARQIAQAIREGRIGRGTRLPSTRALARLLGVSRNTVMTAYETLDSDDLIRSERGSGARVNHWAPVAMPTMAQLLADARYPQRITLISDPDGNPLYLRAVSSPR
jgi:GntR family transcriptional regulator/MocR family aminotransferase